MASEPADSLLPALAPLPQQEQPEGEQGVKKSKNPPSKEKASTRFSLADELKPIFEAVKKEMQEMSRLWALWKKYRVKKPSIQGQNVTLWLIEKLSASHKEIARLQTEIARKVKASAANARASPLYTSPIRAYDLNLSA